MKKFLSTILVVIFASAVGWYFMPDGWRGKISSAAGIVLRGDKQEIKKNFKDTVLPQDPKKRRTVLLGELKKSLAEIKKRGGEDSTNQDFIGTAEEIVKELEKVNHPTSVGREIVERAIERILPVKNEIAECKPR